MTNPPTQDADSTLLRAFIADADESLARGRQGVFWPRNHHKLRPLAGKESGLLTPQEYETYLFHLMRVTDGVPLVTERELPHLIAAWRRLLPLLDSAAARSVSRHTKLFVFGFDDSGALADGELTSAKDLKARMKLIQQINAYTTQPAQRAKMARFAAFADAAPRVLQTLRHLGYRHDRRYDDTITDITNLAFWGMVFVVLLNPQTRADLLQDMLDDGTRLVRRDQHLAMLHAYVMAVLPDVAADETRFLDLAARLQDHQQQRREATESMALARRLDLPVPPDAPWDIAVSLRLKGSLENPLIARDALRLTISPDPDWQWHVLITLQKGGRFSERETAILQNDLSLPGLGQGGLHAFPQWLATLRARHGVDFDTESADIRVGRNRSAAKRLALWLSGQIDLTA